MQSTAPVPRGLERRSLAPGDMKSLIVEEMSILWSAIGGLELVQGDRVVFISVCSSEVVEVQGGAGEGGVLAYSTNTSLTQLLEQGLGREGGKSIVLALGVSTVI